MRTREVDHRTDLIPAVLKTYDTSLQRTRFAEPAVNLVVWTHEPTRSSEDVLVDLSLIPNAEYGDVAEIRTLQPRPRKLYFIVKPLSEEVVKSLPNLQISVSSSLLPLLDVAPRSKVAVRLRKHEEVAADTIELHFKDSYMTRADMWRLSYSLTGSCLYSGGRISYCDTLRTTISDIYRNGRKVFSAYVGPYTKFVYRSESARTVFFIQMSSEMWHFEENGEVIFHKLVNSFLPELFRRWREMDAHHVVTIVLFTSVDVSKRKKDLGQGERERKTRDYFRVVVDQIHIYRWSDIMATLRREFTCFAKEVLQQESGDIEGRILPAVKGNLLEAISLATTMTVSKFLDRDLRLTNTQVVIVTPGAGIFDVDYDLLYQNSMKLLSIEISIDLVCLSQRPLHVTPLFRYKDKEDKIHHCMPSWLDISYWKNTDRFINQWIPRLKIYDIQMMGVMENELSAIAIDYLPKHPNIKSLERHMDSYDAGVFKPKKESVSLDSLAPDEVSPSLLNRLRVTSAEALKPSTATTEARSVSMTFPTEAILSAPSTVEGGSTALLANTIKNRPAIRVSALTSLLNLRGNQKQSSDKGNERSSPSPLSSPALNPQSTQASTTIPQADLLPMNSSSKNAPSLPPPLSDSSLAIRKAKSANFSGLTESRMRTPSGDLGMSKHKQPLSPRGASPQSSLQTTDSKKEEDQDENNHVWVNISNPSNTLDKDIQDISNFGRWKNVFPKGVKRQAVKWKSLKAPSALPLASEIFPSVEEFEHKYTFQIYDVTLDADKEEEMTPGDLMEEMVALRLNMGFQIVVGDRVSKVEAQRRPSGNPALIVQAIPKRDYHGIRIYMTRANQIHRLAIDHYGTINVQLYRKPDLELEDFNRAYHPFVKTRYEEKYAPAVGNFFDPSIRKVNWNLVDQQLAGFDDFYMGGTSGPSSLFKIRFVLIPGELPKSGGFMVSESRSDTLSPEEIRIEGLKKVILQLHRSLEDKKRQPLVKKETKPPEIKFYTGELGTFLLSLLHDYKNYYNDDVVKDGSMRKKEKMFVNETMSRASVKLPQLASEMQGEKGVRFVDRRWHWKTHKNCFIGQEFVAWLLDNFTDIDNSEEAVDYGNQLMENGLFHHVENRHTFLDGHYFYQLSPEFVASKPATAGSEKHDKSWFKRGSADSSNPTGKEGGSDSGGAAGPGHARKTSTSTTSTVESPVDEALQKADSGEPEVKGKSLPKALISRAIKINLDSTGKSKRPEYLTVHVDRVHNPENAFHLRFEWMNATPKLIEETASSLRRTGERWGLKLVQLPIDELSSLPKGNPFSSVVRTRFCADIPSASTYSEFEQGDPAEGDPHYYHRYALRKCGFITDVQSAPSLTKKEVDILYSWGRPFYKYTQYVHRTGTVIAQIVDDNEFLLMANSLHLTRIGAHTTQSNNSSAPPPPDAQEIQFSFKNLCENKEELWHLFNEARTMWIMKRKGGGMYMYKGNSEHSSGSSTPRMARSIVFDKGE